VVTTCFAQIEQSGEMLRKVGKLIIDEMETRGYISQEADAFELSVSRPRGTLTFLSKLFPTKKPLSRRIRSIFVIDTTPHLPSRKEVFDGLRTTIDGYPYLVTFRMKFRTLSDDKKGLELEIESEPAIVAKRRSLHDNREIDEIHYNDVISNNAKFLRDITSALGVTMLEEPKPIRQMEFTKAVNLMDSTFVSSFPADLQACLAAANNCFVARHNMACSILLRKSLDVGISKKFQQAGKNSRLLDSDGYEISLKKKLNIVLEVAPKTKAELQEIRLVKWLGDKAVHDPSVMITPEDITNSMPIFKSFLIDLQLK
jgi:hypothetical protein